jgi:nucleoside-diphosphate-sugar epimerase
VELSVTVLVTGATGHVGTVLVRTLAAHGTPIRAFTLPLSMMAEEFSYPEAVELPCSLDGVDGCRIMVEQVNNGDWRVLGVIALLGDAA